MNHLKSLDKYMRRIRKDIEAAPKRMGRMYLLKLAAEAAGDGEKAAMLAGLVEERLDALDRDRAELVALEWFREELVGDYDEYARRVDEFLTANGLSGAPDDV